LDLTSHLHTHYIAYDSCACEYFKSHNKFLAPLLGNLLICEN
jgi:hypothetical protein